MAQCNLGWLAIYNCNMGNGQLFLFIYCFIYFYKLDSFNHPSVEPWAFV